MAKKRSAVQREQPQQAPDQDIQLDAIAPMREAAAGAVSAPGARSLNGAIGNAAVQQLVGERAGAPAAATGGDGDGGGDGVQALGGFAAKSERSAATIRQAAGRGISGAGGAMPHAGTIQASFGRHDISGVRGHTDDRAAEASADMGAAAYATGEHVAFGSSSPDLHTAAHEAAHVVQQRAGVQLAGGVGASGDAYERHADAVADRVVAGQSAEALLDTMAPSGSGGEAVQRSAAPGAAVQRDISDDLKESMDGWGTDEDAIYGRLRRASQEELQAVLADAALMAMLRDELSRSEMSYVLDLLQAPLATKLTLAMDGWGTDEDYIRRAMTGATPEELLAVAQDAAMVDRLQGELSGEDLRWVFDRLPLPIERRLQMAMDGWGTDEGYIRDLMRRATPEELARVAADEDLVKALEDELSGDDIRGVLDRLPLPLSRKLQYAIRGWGTDEAYIFNTVSAAPMSEVLAVAADGALCARVDDDLSGFELNAWRGIMAKRIWLEAGDRALAYRFIDGDSESDRATRLLWLGDLSVQRGLLDAVITNETASTTVIHAFQDYWLVEIGVRDGATMSQWPVPVLQGIHAQLKVLPSQDTRSGFWTRMTLSDASLIDPTSGRDVGLRNRAAWGDGNFIVGTQASASSTTPYGYGTALTANAAAGASAVSVEEGDRLAVGDTVRVGAEGGLRITAISGATWTLDPALSSSHTRGDRVVPDDASAERNTNWLAATVRHEIGHGVDENMGSTVRGFTVGLGGWWTGDFDDWAAAMPDPWRTDASAPLTEEEKGQIKDAIEDAVSGQKGSLYGLGLDSDHPVVKYRNDNIPVILAAEACLSRGDSFYSSPSALYRAGGRGFSVNFYYKKFMYFNEDIIAQRVSTYSIYAPAEFFAEAYTVFYEEAGRPGVQDADYGRLLRNAAWRNWIRSNIHERGQAPAGTGAEGGSNGASPGGSSKGRSGGNPGP